MAVLPPHITAALFVALQSVAFLFVVIATPISQFDARQSSACWTLWGYKSSCGSRIYTSVGISAFGCAQRRNNMNGGAAFAIISIFTTLAALFFGVLMLMRLFNMVALPVFFSVLSVFTILISWACVAGVATNYMCRSGPGFRGRLNAIAQYGAGFGLMVTAWCLQVVAAIVLILSVLG